MTLLDALRNYLAYLEPRCGICKFKNRRVEFLFFEGNFETHIECLTEKDLVRILVLPLKLEARHRGGYTAECRGALILISETFEYCTKVLGVLRFNPATNLKEEVKKEIKRLKLKKRYGPNSIRRRRRHGKW